MRRIALAATSALLAVSIAAAPAFAGNAGAKPGNSNIVQIVLADDGEFDVLQAAVIKAGLAGALSNTDQYTVFAPTDWAFVSTFRGLLADNTLTEGEVISFINGGGVDTAFGAGALADILLYHVTHGRRTSSSVVAAPRYQMLNGDTLTRSALVSAGIAQVNISASNGVIHVIESVLLP